MAAFEFSLTEKEIGKRMEGKLHMSLYIQTYVDVDARPSIDLVLKIVNAEV